MKSILCKRASLLSPCVSRVSLANLCPIIQACFLSTKGKGSEWKLWVYESDFNVKHIKEWFVDEKMPYDIDLCLLVKVNAWCKDYETEIWFMAGPQVAFKIPANGDDLILKSVVKEKWGVINDFMDRYYARDIIKILLTVKKLDLDQKMRNVLIVKDFRKRESSINYKPLDISRIIPLEYGWKYGFTSTKCWHWGWFDRYHICIDRERDVWIEFKKSKDMLGDIFDADKKVFENSWFLYHYEGVLYIINYYTISVQTISNTDNVSVKYIIYNDKGEFLITLTDMLHEGVSLITDCLDMSKFIRRISLHASIFKSEKTQNKGYITDLYVDSGQVTHYAHFLKEEAITTKTYKLKDSKDFISNPKIGSFDMECYNNNNSRENGYTTASVYALGFTTRKDGVDLLNMFYIEKEQTSQQLVMMCITQMLVTKYHGYTFYCHNLGNYDLIFLVSAICQYNEHCRKKDVITAIFRSKDDTVLKLSLSKIGVNGKKVTIHFLDSLQMLSGSLDRLGKNFDVPTKKGVFPYSFVSENTLFYKGNAPRYEYYENKISLSDYDKPDGIGSKTVWDLKQETLDYLKDDLLCLYQVIDIYSKYVFKNYGEQITASLTKTSLATKIFLNKFYQKQVLPLINKTNVYSDIKHGYFGGITEVYKPYGKDLYYYDVNSLYPFAALSPMPSSTTPKFIVNVSPQIEFKGDHPLNPDLFGVDWVAPTQFKLKDSFGFFFAEVESSDLYIGLLPLRTAEGMIFPRGKWSGWYFSEELKFAYEHGYKIKLIKGYSYNPVEGIFDSYINHFYDMKKKATSMVDRSIAKYFLNGLLGRFGLKLNRTVTKIVDNVERESLLATRNLTQDKQISDTHYLVTHEKEVDKKLTESFGLDYIKVLNMGIGTNDEPTRAFRDVSIATSAAVNAYARIFMNKIKLQILEGGGNIYYTDTDSIVTDKPLPESLIGSELGQFKLEHKIKEGYFISNKTYCIVDSKGLIHIKAKGVDHSSLTLDHFKQLLSGTNVEALQRFSIKDWGKGSVVLTTKPIKLNSDSYNKRVKVYTDDNIWCDTIPIGCNIQDPTSNSQNFRLVQIVCTTTEFVLVDYNIACYNLDLILYIYPWRNKNRKLLSSHSILQHLPSPTIRLCLPSPPILLAIPSPTIRLCLPTPPILLTLPNPILLGEVHKIRTPHKGGRPSQPIEVLDLSTNIKTTYTSMSAAARDLGVSDKSISGYFKRNTKKPFKGLYTLSRV